MQGGILYNIIFDLILICETWLDSGVSDGQLCYNSMYNVIRYDRPSRGGEVCAFVNNSLDYVTTALPNEFKHLEV